MPLVDANGLRTHYRLEGTPGKPLLVLAHPIGSDLSVWDAVVPLLARALRVLRLDLRGHGATAVTPGDTSVDQLARDLLGAVDALGLGAQAFSVAGISLGGMAALQLAAAAPQRVAQLVIANGLPWLPPPPDGWDARAQAALREGMADIAQRMANRQLSAGFRERAPQVAHALQHVCAAMAPQGYASACAVLRDTDLRPALPGIRQPVLVITGAEDPMLKPADVAAMVQALPNARQAVLPTGHLSALEAPEAFAQELLRFLG